MKIIRVERKGTDTAAGVCLSLVVLLCLLTPTQSTANDLDSTFAASFAYREAFLPPGVHSVALRADETAILWNPAGIPMSGTYYLGYAWKGTYYGDDKVVSTHFFLTKARGFGIGWMRDGFSEGVKTTTVFSIAPAVSKSMGLGFTGKWKGGFNFDCGLMLKLGKRISIGLVGRNLRDKENVRRYYEGGIGAFVIPGKLTLHFDVINEDSPWRKETVYGGGFAWQIQRHVGMSASYFTDESGTDIIRGSLNFLPPGEIVEGEYSKFSDDWSTLSARIASHSP
jgi:hypothetical protein